ncbi:hypothetical protein M758_2G148600 [Ceratodon purpureus]|nr:hypothetical protein M758_2G148600 [Ceratodon purpureus]
MFPGIGGRGGTGRGRGRGAGRREGTVAGEGWGEGTGAGRVEGEAGRRERALFPSRVPPRREPVERSAPARWCCSRRWPRPCLFGTHVFHREMMRLGRNSTQG